MILRECIENNNCNFVHLLFAHQLYKKLKKEDEEPEEIIKSYCNNYKKLFETLLSLKVSSSENKKLIVKRIHDAYSLSEIGEFDFDAVLLEDGVEFSFMIMDWEELIDVEIDETSLRLYGSEHVLFEILYEMTWFGLDYEESKKRRDDFEERLNKQVEQIKEMKTDDFVDFDELMKELGVELEDEEQFNQTHEENIKLHNEYYKKVGF